MVNSHFWTTFPFRTTSATSHGNHTANPVTYYYVLNLQSDVLGLINASGTVVARYTYNAWGELTYSSGSMAEINPLRYRGYYYDTETGFYYLQSRYYDPVTHRFINADSFASTGQGVIGHNMFAYCLNNPIICADAEGHDTYVIVGKEEKDIVVNGIKITVKVVVKAKVGEGEQDVNIEENEGSIVINLGDNNEHSVEISTDELMSKSYSYALEMGENFDFVLSDDGLGVCYTVDEEPFLFEITLSFSITAPSTTKSSPSAGTNACSYGTKAGGRFFVLDCILQTNRMSISSLSRIRGQGLAPAL